MDQGQSLTVQVWYTDPGQQLVYGRDFFPPLPWPDFLYTEGVIVLEIGVF